MADEGQQGTQERKVIDDAQLKKLLANQKPSFMDQNKGRLVTLILIAINCIIYAVEVVQAGFSFNIPSLVLIEMGAMFPPALQSSADLYRFITPMFLHVDAMHIAFNMVALYSVGALLERVLGKANFLLLYFMAGITGNAVSYYSDVLLTGGMTVSAGASTSVFGLFMAAALLGVLHVGNKAYFTQFSKGMLGIIGINVLYTFLVPGISISGHLGGALGGLIAMFVVPSKNLKVSNIVRVIVAIVWSFLLGVMLVSQGLIG